MMEINWVTTACHSGGCIEVGWVTTDCSGGDCIEVGTIGADWFRIRSTMNPHQMVAVTGEELRAFLRQVRAGQFDDIARLERDTTVDELLTERDALLAEIAELREFADRTDEAMGNVA